MVCKLPPPFSPSLSLLLSPQPALTNTLSFTIGVKSYNVSLETQTADVTTNEEVAYETVLEKIKKTGKTVNSGEADGIVMAVA